MGTDGFEFVEYTGPDPAQLADLAAAQATAFAQLRRATDALEHFSLASLTLIGNDEMVAWPFAAFAAALAEAVGRPVPPGFVASIVGMGLIYFGFKFLRYALDSWSALILGEHFGFSTSISAYLSTAYDWVGFLGVIAAGYWSDRLPGSRRTSSWARSCSSRTARTATPPPRRCGRGCDGRWPRRSTAR